MTEKFTQPGRFTLTLAHKRSIAPLLQIICEAVVWWIMLLLLKWIQICGRPSHNQLNVDIQTKQTCFVSMHVMLSYVLGRHIFGSSFLSNFDQTYTCIKPTMQRKTLSGSFAFAAMFVERLTEVAEVAGQKPRDGSINYVPKTCASSN